MPGGILNILATGNQNIFLTGNPKKTFFKAVYAKYTNFGLQKFRIDFNGLRTLRMSEDSLFSFKIPRYGDLLMDTYLSVTLPHIWSPIYPPHTTDLNNPDSNNDTQNWIPYEFKWINDIGAHMIREITVTCGSTTLQKYSGEYLSSLVKRDFTDSQKKLFDEMSGNIPQFNDPANAYSRSNVYPNAYYDPSTGGAEPSIRGRQLFIPLNLWFGNTSKQAFPLIALQYNELVINVTIRSVNELFRIRDVKDKENDYPMIQPQFNVNYQQMYNFIQTPPNTELTYIDKRTNWNADVHLISTYGFLTKDEAKVFASKEQKYLIKDVFENTFNNVTGSKKVKTESHGMVSSWMFFFRRSDANLRNEWSNYTNWPYNFLPRPISYSTETVGYINPYHDAIISPLLPSELGPAINANGDATGLHTTGPYTIDNQKEILQTMGILFDGKYRENTFTSGIYNYCEKYLKSNGSDNDGLYCYNFCLETSPFSLQPSGAVNCSKFSTIELEFTTHSPAFDVNAQVLTICDENGVIIGINKPTWQVYDYSYDLRLFEERFNMLIFSGGNCGLMYAR
mgnify:FL=1